MQPFHSKCSLKRQQQQQQQPSKALSQSSTSQSSQLSSGYLTKAQKSNDPSLKKPPRTIHIDVYCTESDVENVDNNCRNEEELSSSSSENLNELESNSTPQTVLDINQMLLRHHRAGKHEIPRLLKIQQEPKHQKSYQQLFDHLSPDMVTSQELNRSIVKSNTTDEILESKQILFKKHIGDQKNNKSYIINRTNFRKASSDDCLSSNYPNSSQSTIRDLTSSISSVVASNICEDIETSWKETDAAIDETTTISIGKSDSFKYNLIHRLRIERIKR